MLLTFKPELGTYEVQSAGEGRGTKHSTGIIFTLPKNLEVQ